MDQRWGKILFLHWPIEETSIRQLLPAALELDTFEQSAWVSVTPFHLSGLRLHSAPPIPGLNSFNEINVRTYVHYKGKPGIYFFSLDASKLVPALAARVFYRLPYFSAEIEYLQSSDGSTFEMKRPKLLHRPLTRTATFQSSHALVR